MKVPAALHVNLPFRGAFSSLGRVSITLITVAQPAWAAVLVMNNGDRLTGSLESFEGGVLKFNTPYAGTIAVQWDQVTSFHGDGDSDAKVVVLTTEDQVHQGRVSVANRSGIEMRDADGEEVVLATAEIAAINPEAWRTGLGVTETGRIELAAKSAQRTQTENEIDLSGEYQVRRKQDRTIVRGNLEYDRTAGITVEEKWSLGGEYDLFRGKKFYYSLAAFAEHDKSKGLEQRYQIGPGIGYQFYEGEDLNLRAKWSVQYVTSTFEDRSTSEGFGSGWEIDYDQFVYQRQIQLYHRQTGIVSDSENTHFKSASGLRFPLFDGFLAALELEANWEAEPADGADSTEFIYSLKAGYGW